MTEIDHLGLHYSAKAHQVSAATIGHRTSQAKEAMMNPDPLVVAQLALTFVQVAVEVRKIFTSEVQAPDGGGDHPKRAVARTIYIAIAATEDYLAGNKAGVGSKSLDKLWSNASAAVYKFDQDLAYRMYLKADYWSDFSQRIDPISKESMKRMRITLEDMKAEMLRFLDQT
ncbi:hypothetical protein QTH87_25245 [Variovorax sp. J22P168]|uniref:hypothetical protein n=1 Tax=Variovorax jilinensis TaxID=3053513 RepID=UPI002574DC3A|nr:hypothetical protein [Variovorax sp. J22P168]MDM0015770.1 hypothetical protein [Variovorax sp. J22P168]